MIIDILCSRWCVVADLLAIWHLLTHLVLIFAICILVGLMILVLNSVLVWVLYCINHFLHLVLRWLVILLTSFFLLLLHLAVVGRVSLSLSLKVVITPKL